MPKTPTWAFLTALLLLPFQGHAAGQLEKSKNGVILKLSDGFLSIRFLTDTILRVSFAKDRKFFSRESISVIPSQNPKVPWSLKKNKAGWNLEGRELTLSIDRDRGLVQFLTAAGQPLLTEENRSLVPAQIQGKKTFHVQQQWGPHPEEALYGLGQNQYGFLDLKGLDFDLWQHNSNVAIPLLVSSLGYGILWDNPSFTRFGDPRDFIPIPAENLLDKNGCAGGLTAQTLDRSAPASQSPNLNVDIHPQPGETRPPSTFWEGFILAPQSGDYQLQCRSNGGIKVWLNHRLVMEHWRQGWLTDKDLAKVHLESGKRYPLRMEWDREQGTTFQFTWKTPPEKTSTSLWSEAGGGIDYYFVYGPKLDKVLAGCRFLTGQAPLMPSWVFGLWQSRQRYETQQESLDVVDGFRGRKIPFDNIVQDWRYWTDGAWGSHQFDPSRFPDPKGWLQKLHEKNTHVMISVWGKFYPGSKNFEELHRTGGLYDSLLKEGVKDWLGFPYTFYDAFNPKARALFWKQMDEQLFQRGIDAWWMDSTEPDLMPSPPDREAVESHMGGRAQTLNAYPLLNSEAVYQGQRKAAPNQRVFILTRSAFTGSQRTASALWSGDITANWSVFAKQIPAGLNLSLSGIPYWTTDIGGYTIPRKFSASGPKSQNEEEWRELNTRWFQFSTFCPLLRAHGELRKREMWEFGGGSSPAYKAMLKFDRLRYRMFPYLYSTAWDVTKAGGTFMRPLVMDFPKDNQVRDLTDEYMFGKAFLAAPVVQYKARSRPVYLPPEAIWYDFWTGKAASPGRQDSSAPYDSIPLFVRAGSIVPFGPDLQYISEKPQDPTTLYIYEGGNADFTLYEDDGLTYGYEAGEYSEIPIRWDDKAKKLILGGRKGSFKGMLSERTFNLVLVSKETPAGFSFEARPKISLKYNGAAAEYQADVKP